MKIAEKWPDMALNLAENRGILRKCVSRGAQSLDLTIGGQVRKVLLVAPNGSERSEKLGRGNLARNTFRKLCRFFCVPLNVWVLFVNSIVCLFVFVLCLFFVFECFWLGLLTGFSGWFFWALTFLFLFGEFDPGSGRTLAACLTHASRTLKPSFCWVDEWRTGE